MVSFTGVKVARRCVSLRPGLIVNDTECPFLVSNRSVGSSKCPRTYGSIATQGNKTVLVLDGQAEANVAAKFFVSREDECSCPSAGLNPKG